MVSYSGTGSEILTGRESRVWDKKVESIKDMSDKRGCATKYDKRDEPTERGKEKQL